VAGDRIRAWRTYAQIFYVCGRCDGNWTIELVETDAAKPQNTTNSAKVDV